MTEERTEERRGFGRIFRTIAIGVLLIVIAAGGGFATGYFLRDQEITALEQRLNTQKEEMTAQINSLKVQVLEAQKSQLEQALTRAKLRAGLEQVLEFLTEALAEVEQRNFGRAMQKISAAKGALNAAGSTTASFRDAVVAKLDEIRAGLEQLDVNTGEKISSLTKDLEKGVAPGKTSE
ncbi:MAG: hypothetical protein ACE5K9_01745 [Candidatus Methylomirabilales bacterium]